MAYCFSGAMIVRRSNFINLLGKEKPQDVHVSGKAFLQM